MTHEQILAMQSYILACVKYEAAHHLEKSEALMTMIVAQNRMHELMLDSAAPAGALQPDQPDAAK